jgi:hypothetical protein
MLLHITAILQAYTFLVHPVQAIRKLQPALRLGWKAVQKRTPPPDSPDICFCFDL